MLKIVSFYLKGISLWQITILNLIIAQTVSFTLLMIFDRHRSVVC